MTETLLSTSGLVAGYGRQTTLHGVDIGAPTGAITAIIGPNGSGKSTLLKTVAGLIRAREGSVRFDGEEIAGRPAHALVSRGLCMVPQGRVVFPLLTVEENLRMSGFTLRPDPLLRERVAEAFDAWPVLAARRRQPAGTLSGGEQMMLSLAKVTLLRPRLLLLDEPSLGLAPKMIDEVYGRLVSLAAGGLTTVVVEQNVRQALKVAAHAVVLVLGEVRYQGEVARLESEVDLGRLFLEGR